MIAISLWQPWASAIAVGLKKFETRSWKAECIGHRIAIHAAKRNTPKERAWWMKHVKGCGDIVDLNAHAFHEAGIHDWTDLPLGAVVCTADLIAVTPTAELIKSGRVFDGGLEFCWGNYDAIDEEKNVPRYGWELANVVALPKPVPCIGRQGFFMWDQPK